MLEDWSLGWPFFQIDLGAMGKKHFTQRLNWLRASVLGANDGIISTASLILGVAVAGEPTRSILIAGSASLVAGAISMAADEYVSVSSQADTEKADLEREKEELDQNPEAEKKELTNIYVERGLSRSLAKPVAEQLMEKDALKAHAREELGIIEIHKARPIQAALASASAFTFGALLPLALAYVTPVSQLPLVVSGGSLLFLGLLGGLAAKFGGARILVGVSRVMFWGVLAMLLTSLIGFLLRG